MDPQAYPVELEASEAFTAAMRRQAWLLGGTMLLAAGMFVIVLITMRLDPIAVLTQGGLILAAGAGVTWMFAREALMPARLRVTATDVALLRRGECVAQAPLADVYATQRALLIGAKRVVYRMADPKMGRIPPTYDPDAFQRTVLSRVPASRQVDDGAFNREWIARQPLRIKALALCVFLLVMVLAFRGAFVI